MGFAGVICFAGPYDDKGTAAEPKTEAAFILDLPTHVPRYSINGATHVSMLGPPPVTTLSMLGGGGASTSQAFKTYVPQLGTLTRGSIKYDRNSPNAIHFRLPPVQLDVAAYYPVKAIYGLDGQVVFGPSCIAMVTVFDLTLPDGITVSIFGRDTTIVGDMWILLENLPTEAPGAQVHQHAQGPQPSGSGAPPSSHFKIHRKVTTAVDDYDIAEIFEVPADPCGLSASPNVTGILAHIGAQHPTISLHPECSNSQWP